MKVYHRYRESFFVILQQLVAAVWLDWESIRDMFGDLVSIIPALGSGVSCRAGTQEFLQLYKPFSLVVSAMNPPNAVSKTELILRLGLLNVMKSWALSMEQDREVDYYAASVYLFANGRKVLKVYGLTLDTSGELSAYKPSAMREDSYLFVREPLPLVYQMLERWMVEFQLPPGDTRSEVFRDQALEEFRQPLSDDDLEFKGEK
jgi:hypothetical protein